MDHRRRPKGGERVVVNGIQKARPGATVKAVPWPPQARSRSRRCIARRGEEGRLTCSPFFIDRPVSPAIALVILLAGSLSLHQTARLPSIRPWHRPPSPSTSPILAGRVQVIEETVTALIEQEMNGIEHLLYMESSGRAKRRLGDPTFTRRN